MGELLKSGLSLNVMWIDKMVNQIIMKAIHKKHIQISNCAK